MKMYLIPEDLRNALMDYLRKQPYGAVAAGMKALENLHEVREPVPAPQPAEPLHEVKKPNPDVTIPSPRQPRAKKG